MKSLSLNAFLNTIRNILNMVFPIITFPYVSRILGAHNLGIYNFSNTYVNYFLLLAALGINTYAIREGAKYRDNREEINKFVGQIFSINLVATVISYLLLASTLILFNELKMYAICILIFSIQIIFTTIGVEWIYSIYEDYAYITIRSIVFKILSIILLFIFVKKPDDYLIYAGITVFASIGSNILNYIHINKFCDLKFTLNMHIKEHIKPILIIFASNIAIMIYVNSDITILGLMKSAYIVGIYTVSTKIYSVLKTVLSSALIVTVPRLSMLFGKKKWDEYQKVASYVFNLLLMLTLPTTAGLIATSKNVIILIAGEKYASATCSLQLLSIAIIFSIFSWFYNDCILIPAKNEKIVLYSTIFSAILNILLNILLIPTFSLNAAAFSTIIAELVGMIISVHFGRKVITIQNLKHSFFTVIIASSFVYIVAILPNFLFSMNALLSLIVSAILSLITYVFILVFLKNEIMLSILKIKL